MYFKGINPIKALLKDPFFSWNYYLKSGLRVAYIKFRKRKLRTKIYAGKLVKSNIVANEILKNSILKGDPYMFGRYGTNELNCVTEYLLSKKEIIKKIRIDELKMSCLQSGIFPLDEKTIIKFSEIVLESTKEVDLFGTFRMILEDYYLKKHSSKKSVLTNLNMMNFWQYDEPFTYALKGKRVLVIHPFAETIEAQYKKRQLLFKNENYLPEFTLLTLKAVQTIAGNRDDRFDNWFEALEYMYNKAKNTDFDIALIGCGSYGFPLAAKLKKEGKIVITMGGVTQMLFGIKGNRWDVDPVASSLYNDYWVRPDISDLPNNAGLVEGSCYW